jgi:hypothetical protein
MRCFYIITSIIVIDSDIIKQWIFIAFSSALENEVKSDIGL